MIYQNETLVVALSNFYRVQYNNNLMAKSNRMNVYQYFIMLRNFIQITTG